jgi:hypothetical protein
VVVGLVVVGSVVVVVVIVVVVVVDVVGVVVVVVGVVVVVVVVVVEGSVAVDVSHVSQRQSYLHTESYDHEQICLSKHKYRVRGQTNSTGIPLSQS